MRSTTPTGRQRWLTPVSLLVSTFLLFTSVAAQPASAMDHEAPELVEFDFSPKSVDVTNEAQTVTVTARITDATGAYAPHVYVESESPRQQLESGPMTLVSGTAQDGIYQRILTVPTSVVTSSWSIEISSLHDTEGNSGARRNVHPDMLRVTGLPADHEPPEVVEFDFSPRAVDVTDGPQRVTVTARITDASGTGNPLLTLVYDQRYEELGLGTMTRVSGSSRDGVYQRTVTVPVSTSTGSWSVNLYGLHDDVGNNGAGLTHPAKLRVTNKNALRPPSAPSLIVAVAGDGSASVAWTEPSDDGGSPVTGYRIHVEPGVKTVTTKGTSTTVTGLANGSGHWFTVQAINEVGPGPKSQMSPMVTPRASKPAPTPTPVPKPTPPATSKPTPPAALDVYTTPGTHTVNGRQWRTRCEPYSETERCRTEIWATQVSHVNSQFVQSNGWVFNNLTYAPSPRSLWRYNPLGAHGMTGGTEQWVAADGRKWRTECDTAVTGRGGCRSYIEASVVETHTTSTGQREFRWVTKWILNNMVRFR